MPIWSRQVARIFWRKRRCEVRALFFCVSFLVLYVIYSTLFHTQFDTDDVISGPSSRRGVTSASISVGSEATSFGDDVITPLFRDKPLVIWSSNFHPTPVIDLMSFLGPLGVRFINKELSNKYCQHFNTCTTGDPLRYINSDNILALNNLSDIVPLFYDQYKDDPQMKSVDAFLCCDPPSACEVFEPFQKSVIVVATTRYNIGRSIPWRWKLWNQHLTQMASQPWNVVGANNEYDQQYIKYFTGIDGVQLLPSACEYTRGKYEQSRPGFLLWMRPRDKKFHKFFWKEFHAECAASNTSGVRLNGVRELYLKYDFSDLSAHQGIVHLPYQVSVMAVLEQYRMNVPLFFPSKDLLIDWHRERFILHEKSESPPILPIWEKRPLKKSNLPAHPTQRGRPDPNNDKNVDAVRHWLQFADYYALPHIIYFNSTLHLAQLLSTVTSEQLWKVSRKMAEYNRKSVVEIRNKWKRNLLNIAEHSRNQPH